MDGGIEIFKSKRALKTIHRLMALGLLAGVFGCRPEPVNRTDAEIPDREEVLADWHGLVVGGELVKVGSMEGPDHQVLGRISGAAFVGSGLAIADSHTNRIHWYDRNGHHVVSAGGTGDGPGEFRRIHSLDVLPDGTLAALDLGGKIEFFGSDGNHKESIRFPGNSREMCLLDSTVVIHGRRNSDWYAPLHLMDLADGEWTSIGEIQIPDHLRVNPSNERVLISASNSAKIACVAGRIVFARSYDGLVSAMDRNGSVHWDVVIPEYVSEELKWVPGMGLRHTSPEGAEAYHMVWGATGIGEFVSVQIVRMPKRGDPSIFSVFLDINSGEVLGKDDSLPQWIVAADGDRIAVASGDGLVETRKTPIPELVTYSITWR